MKAPIAWHQNNLGNMRRTVAREESRLRALTMTVARLKEEVLHREQQITRAIAEKRTEFDEDKFGVKRRV